MLLLDRHRVAILLELCRLGAASEAARVANSDALGTVLLGLYNGATTSARKAFLDRMNPLPQSQKPWGAVTPTPSHPTPAVVLLLYGQRDDDPDAAEDGNRLPERGSAVAAPWEPLYAAIDRWDLDAIVRFIGPLGWRVPLADAVLKGSEADQGEPAPPMVPVPNPGPAPPLPPVPRPPDPSPPVPANFWRRPEVLVAGGVGAGLLVAVLFQSLRRPSAPEVRA
jgi:hypothetical protein